MTGAVQTAQQREDVSAKIKDAFYAARDGGRTMHQAADEAADSLRAAGFLADTPPPGLVEALRALTVTFAAFERTYAVHKADTYAEGARDAWDLAESNLRGLLDKYADNTGSPT